MVYVSYIVVMATKLLRECCVLLLLVHTLTLNQRLCFQLLNRRYRKLLVFSSTHFKTTVTVVVTVDASSAHNLIKCYFGTADHFDLRFE